MTIPYRAEIVTAAAAHRLDAELLAAQVLVESSGQADAFRFEPAFYKSFIRGNPRAKAARFGPLAACSYGLLQIMLETAYEDGYSGQPWDLFVPEIGLDWGARHLARRLTWAKGDIRQALAAYNGGTGGNETAPFRNQAYAVRVFKMKEQLVSESTFDA